MKDFWRDLELLRRNIVSWYYAWRCPLEKVSSALVMVYQRLSRMENGMYVSGGICPVQELRALCFTNKISWELRYRAETALLTQIRPHTSIRNLAISCRAISEDAELYNELYMNFRNNFVIHLADVLCDHGN